MSIDMHYALSRGRSPGETPLALGLADGAALPLPLPSAARRSLGEACAAGYAEAGFSCVARLLSSPAGPAPDPAPGSNG